MRGEKRNPLGVSNGMLVECRLQTNVIYYGHVFLHVIPNPAAFSVVVSKIFSARKPQWKKKKYIFVSKNKRNFNFIFEKSKKIKSSPLEVKSCQMVD